MVRLALEAVFWWSAVIAWNISEGRRTGRSWRTQVGRLGRVGRLLRPAHGHSDGSVSPCVDTPRGYFGPASHAPVGLHPITDPQLAVDTPWTVVMGTHRLFERLGRARSGPPGSGGEHGKRELVVDPACLGDVCAWERYCPGRGKWVSTACPFCMSSKPSIRHVLGGVAVFAITWITASCPLPSAWTASATASALSRHFSTLSSAVSPVQLSSVAAGLDVR